ncbi:MAG: DMT family transporter [Bacteroidales bacterium]|nr:DMT family transporter [Bacteroidales bacterium]
MTFNSNSPSWGYHILAIITIFVWGTTFASTKVLLNHNLTPAEIMCYRFGIAYVLSWFFSRKILAQSFADEFFLAIAGFMGGTIYFLAENTALQYTITSNVALIVCSTPVLTALLAIICIKSERITARLTAGSLIALAGMALVVLNGKILKFNPIGDTLAFIAALSWAVYSVVLRRFDGRYSMWFVTRKIFFYGLITMMPVILLDGEPLHLESFSHTQVSLNILFLGIIASMLCFYSWNLVLEKLGTIRASNYLYSQPVVSLVCSVAILHEPLTIIAVVGTVFILFGIYVAQNGLRPWRKK